MIYTLLGLLGVITSLHALPTSTDDSVLAYTEYGYVRGKMDGNIRRWAGIPFAAAPVGSLRFKSPQPFAAAWGANTTWDHPSEGHPVLDATSIPPACPQPTNVTMSEDCLKLIVYAPEATRRSSRKGFPVMVWIHGGGFSAGSAYEGGLYDGRKLVEAKDVVVVAIQYRLAAFGFYSAGDQTEASANAGIEDQRMALEWVQRNIAYFGGDRTRVTIFGESAGAQSVMLHLTSPKTRPGLFHRAIAQSPYPFLQMHHPDRVAQLGTKFAGLLGCAERGDVDMTCMRSKSMEQILAATQKMEPTGAIPNNEASTLTDSNIKAGLDNKLTDWAVKSMIFEPSIDRDNVVGNVLDLMQQGKYAPNIPLIVGYTREEIGLYLKDITPAHAQMYFSDPGYIFATEKLVGKDAAHAVLSVYPPQGDATKNGIQVLRALTDYIGSCPLRRVATIPEQSPPFAPIYLYEWIEPGFPDGWCQTMSCHSADLPYTFGNGVNVKPALHEAMRDYWVNFATTGSPNKGWAKSWPAFGEKRQRMMLGGTEVARLVNDDKERECKLWEHDVGYSFGRSETTSD